MTKLEAVADLASLSPIQWLASNRQDRVRMVDSISKSIRFIQDNTKIDHDAPSIAKHIDIRRIPWPPTRPLTQYDRNKEWIQILPCDAITAAFVSRVEAPTSRIVILNPTDGKDPDAWLRGSKNIEASFYIRSTLFRALRQSMYEDAFRNHNGLIYNPNIKVFSITPAAEMQLWQEKHIYVNFISCVPLHPDTFKLKTVVTNEIEREIYADSKTSSAMYAKIIAIFKTAALEGIQTLILVPFGTEPKYRHPVEVIAKLYELVLFGTKERPPIDWRSFGIRKVIVAIDGVETNGWCAPDQKVYEVFQELFSDLVGVDIDSTGQTVRRAIAAVVRA